MSALEYRQVDVFAEQPLSGNGLAVFTLPNPLSEGLMQQLTCELRQFESIFLAPAGDGEWHARVFTMEEELPFAGHPAIGAAAVLHERAGGERFTCRLALRAGTIALESVRTSRGYRVTMHQGPPSFGSIIPGSDERQWLELFGLSAGHRDRRMPLAVASTGLPYVVLPVTAEGLAEARVESAELEERLASVGAKFAYVFDLMSREGRTWDNAGAVEDIATGSAAGPVAALLVRHGLAALGERIVVDQGRFVGRPSRMELEVIGEGADFTDVVLTGHVCMVGRGTFDAAIGEG